MKPVQIYPPQMPRSEQPRGGAVLHVQDLQDRSREWSTWYPSVEHAQVALRQLASGEGAETDAPGLHATLIPGDPEPLRRAWIERRHSTRVETDGPRTVVHTEEHGDRVTVRRWKTCAEIMVTEQGRSAVAHLTIEEAETIADALWASIEAGAG